VKPFSTYQSRLALARSRNESSQEYINDIQYIPKLNLVFAFISKNASTYLKAFMFCWAHDINFRVDVNMHNRRHSGFLGVDDLGEASMLRLLEDDGIPKVVVGRNPEERLRSAWRSRVDSWTTRRQEDEPRHDEVHEWIRIRQEVLGSDSDGHCAPALRALQEDITFGALVDYVAETPSSLLDRHFVPQTFQCASDLFRYDLVGQMESLPAFISSLANLIERPEPTIQAWPLNVSSSNGIGDCDGLNDGAREKIQQRYAQDYAFFGYDLV